MDCLRFQKPTRFFYHFIFGCLLLAITACTSEKDEPASVRLDLSSYTGLQKDLKAQSSSTAAKIGMIAVSVSGPGMSAVTSNWQGFNCRSVCTPPSQFDLSVPSGNDRLIQLLLVIENPETRGMVFLYGETKANLSPGPQSVSLKLSAAGGSSGKEASLHGRYFLPGGVAYTGKVNMSFVPLTGTAPMKLFELEMFSGWINLFVLDGAKFVFTIPSLTPHVMFGGPINMNSPIVQSTTNTLRITVPATTETYQDGGVTVEETRPEKAHVISYWAAGQPMSGQLICHIDETTEYSYSGREISTGVDLNWTDFIFNPSGKKCSEIEEDDDLPLVEAGKIRLHPRVFEHSGGDQLFNQGPFMRSRFEGTEYRYLDYSLSGDTMSLNWEYMPGVFGGANPIQGVKIFGRSNTVGSDRVRLFDGMGSPGCREAASYGFVELKTIANNENTATLTGITSDMQVIVCPFRGTELLQTGISTREHHSCGPGGCGPNNPATKLALVPPPGFDSAGGYVNENACVQMHIEAQDSSGNPGYLDGTYEYTVDVTGPEAANVLIYDTPVCEPGYHLEFPKPLNGHVTTIFVRVTSNNPLPVSNAFSMTVTATGGPTLTAATLNDVDIQANAESVWGFIAPSSIYITETCVPFLVQYQDANGQPVQTSETSRDFSLFEANGGAVHDQYDPNCINTSASTLPAGLKTNVPFYFKPGTLGAGHVTLKDSLDDSEKTHNFSIVDPGPATYLVLDQLSLYTGDCYRTTVRSYTGHGITAVSNEARAIHVAAISEQASVSLYDDDYCGSPLSPPFSLAAGQSEKKFSVRIQSPDPGETVEVYVLDVTGGGVTPLDTDENGTVHFIFPL